MIYTITGIVDPFKKDFCTRCFGYSHDSKIAIEMVEENYMDIHEYTYNYIVIEPVDEGLHPISMPYQQMWFKYNKETRRFVKIGLQLPNEINLHGMG